MFILEHSTSLFSSRDKSLTLLRIIVFDEYDLSTLSIAFVDRVVRRRSVVSPIFYQLLLVSFI